MSQTINTASLKPLVLTYAKEGKDLVAASLLLAVDPDLRDNGERWTAVRDTLHEIGITDRSERLTDRLADALDELFPLYGEECRLDLLEERARGC